MKEETIDIRTVGDDLLRAYEQGLEDGKPRWIPVSERLPENDKTVLVWNRRNSREYFNVYDHGKWVIMETEDITHWMPLPEPPKEET